MADTKISDLSAVSAALAAQEIPVNDAGTTKKLTLAQLNAKHVPIVARRTAGDLTVNGTSWADLDNGLDLVLAAVVAGDLVQVGLTAIWNSETVTGALDAVSIVSASPVTSWGADAAPNNTYDGVLAWFGQASQIESIGGSVIRAVVSGDLAAGSLTIRFRVRTTTAANKLLFATAVNPICVYAINHGQ